MQTATRDPRLDTLDRIEEAIKAVAASVERNVNRREDLAQEGRLRVWSLLETHPGNTDPWYVACARNRMISILRTEQSASTTLEKATDDARHRMRGGAATRGHRDVVAAGIVAALLAPLEPQAAEVLKLKAQGYTGPMIAKKLGIGDQAARSRVTRAIRDAREHAGIVCTEEPR